MNIARIVTRLLWENVVSKFAEAAQAKVQVGAYTYGNPKVAGTHPRALVIGKFCSIADDATFAVDNHSSGRRVANYPLPWRLRKLKKITIEQERELSSEQLRELPNVFGSDVWIGAGAIILPEVRIGDGAIVGAGAVVTHDVPAYAVVAGVPARILRYRFSQEQIKQLLKIAWWNWDTNKIAANITKFYGDVDDFIREFGCSQMPTE